MPNTEHWQLWQRPEGDLRFWDPTNRWRPKPGPPWVHVATLRVDRGAGRVLDRPPVGMLLGDPTNQQYGLGGPHFLYADLQRQCATCRSPFVWSARSQKRLYEQAQAWVDVVQRLCPACARGRRADRRAQKRLMEAHAVLAGDDGPAAHLALAEATLEACRQLGTEALRRGLGAARKAAKDPALAAAARTADAALRAELDAREGSARLP